MRPFQGIARKAFQGPTYGRIKLSGRYIEGAGVNTKDCPGFSFSVSHLPWKTFSLVFIRPSTNDSTPKFCAMLKLVHVCPHPASLICSQLCSRGAVHKPMLQVCTAAESQGAVRATRLLRRENA